MSKKLDFTKPLEAVYTDTDEIAKVEVLRVLPECFSHRYMLGWFLPKNQHSPLTNSPYLYGFYDDFGNPKIEDKQGWELEKYTLRNKPEKRWVYLYYLLESDGGWMLLGSMRHFDSEKAARDYFERNFGMATNVKLAKVFEIEGP